MNYQMELFRSIAAYSLSKNLSIGQGALQVAHTVLSVFGDCPNCLSAAIACPGVITNIQSIYV